MVLEGLLLRFEVALQRLMVALKQCPSWSSPFLDRSDRLHRDALTVRQNISGLQSVDAVGLILFYPGSVPPGESLPE